MTICNTLMFYRMICRIDEGIGPWDDNNSSPYDTCGEGKSALFTALIRNLTAEGASLLGNHAANVFIDFQKFFDNIDLVKLTEEAIHLEVPLNEFLIGVQQHSVPRVLQFQGMQECQQLLQKHFTRVQESRDTYQDLP